MGELQAQNLIDSYQPHQAFSSAYAMASSKPSCLPLAHTASHLAFDNR